jgi:hypothetical protein
MSVKTEVHHVIVWLYLHYVRASDGCRNLNYFMLFYNVAYALRAKQLPLSKQQYDQPLLGNNSVKRDHYETIAETIMLATIVDDRNGVSWRSLLNQTVRNNSLELNGKKSLLHLT